MLILSDIPPQEAEFIVIAGLFRPVPVSTVAPLTARGYCSGIFPVSRQERFQSGLKDAAEK
jgi:hypothetical protein